MIHCLCHLLGNGTMRLIFPIVVSLLWLSFFINYLVFSIIVRRQVLLTDLLQNMLRLQGVGRLRLSRFKLLDIM